MKLRTVRTPKAFRLAAQGWRETPTLGKRPPQFVNPNGVVAASTLLGLNHSRFKTQGSLRQPWAGCRNAFGVLHQVRTLPRE